jgi:hypothetical protein
MTYILVRSKDRIVNGVPSNFSVKLNTRVKSGKTIKLEYLQMYANQPNINSKNNILGITSISGTAYHTIPIGFYSSCAKLAVTLNTLLTSMGITIVYDPNMSKFYVSNSSSLQRMINPDLHNQSILDILGLNQKTQFIIPGNVSQIYFPNVSVITPTPSLGLQVNSYSNDIVSSNNTNIYTFIVPMDVSLGSLISYRPNQYFPQSAKISDTFEYLDRIDVKVFDTGDNTLFESSSDWEMLLSIID